VTKFSIAALIINPFLLAFGSLAMRKMRKMPETVVALYLNPALVIVSIVWLMIINGSQAFKFMSDLDW